MTDHKFGWTASAFVDLVRSKSEDPRAKDKDQDKDAKYLMRCVDVGVLDT